MQDCKFDTGSFLQGTLSVLALMVVLAAGIPSVQAADEPVKMEAGLQAELQAEALSLVKAFAGELKPTLKAAIEQGGAVHAISVCAEEAPAIASRLSESSGWQIKRVSLQARNRSTAVADDFERQVLEIFDGRQQQGVPVSKLSYSATVDGRYRFMKAQGVEPLCLKCHGQSLSQSVQAALAEYYPDDQATGYSLGEVRGAFSLTRLLP